MSGKHLPTLTTLADLVSVLYDEALDELCDEDLAGDLSTALVVDLLRRRSA
jgi:hypothetical protein